MGTRGWVKSFKEMASFETEFKGIRAQDKPVTDRPAGLHCIQHRCGEGWRLCGARGCSSP